MNTKTFEFAPDQPLVITARKDLKLQGDAVTHVEIQSRDLDKATWTEKEGYCELSLWQPTTVTLPVNARIRLENCRGHVECADLTEAVRGDHIGGHAKFRRTGPLSLEDIGGHAHINQCQGDMLCSTVGGHLHVNDCAGHLRIRSVGGHAKVIQIGGDCELPAVGGHANLQQVAGTQTVMAGGHARTTVVPAPETTHSIKAGGNASVQVPRDANATIHLSSPTLPPSSPNVRTMGNGSAAIHVTAGGHIALQEQGTTNEVPEAPDSVKTTQWAFDGLRQQVRSGLNQAFAKAGDKLNQVMDENGLDPQQRADLQAQFTDIRNEALEVAKEAAGAVQVRTREVWEQDVKPTIQSHVNSSSESGGEVAVQAKSEERKMILRMLSEGKITVDEANALLQTLDG